VNNTASPNIVVAIVQKIIADGPHGPFAVTDSEQIEGSVTVSLSSPAWGEDQWPEEGTVVVLDDLRKKRAGWRAYAGRFFRPTDEPTAQQQGAESNG